MKKTTLYKYVAVGSCLVVATFVLVRAIDKDMALRYHPNPSIFAAIDRVDADAIEALIELGADPTERDRGGNTPLQMAVARTNNHARIEMANVLLAHDIDVNAQNLAGETALHAISHHYSREYGTDRLISILLKHGADPNLKDKWGQTLLTLVASRKYDTAVAVLLEGGATIGFYDAIYLGDVKRARTFIDAGQPICQLFGPSAKTALMIAASENQFEIVEMLLNAGAYPNAKSLWNRTALMVAADPSIVRLLLDRGANYRIRDNWGLTAVHYAAQWGTPERLEVLIAAGAELNPETYTGEHTIHYAARNKSPEALAWLLQRDGIDIDKADDSRSTPLHVACTYRNKAQAELLVNVGASLNAIDAQGRTPLHLAVGTSGYYAAPPREIVELLLSHGADASLPDAEGRSPKDLGHRNVEFKGILW